MPIAAAPGMPDDPATGPVLTITEGPQEIRVIETWPPSSGHIADIGEDVSGSGPNVTLTLAPGDPLSCAWRAEQSSSYRREGWEVAIRAEVAVTATAGAFQVEERTLATLNGVTVADVKHTTAIPRVLA